MVTTFYQHFLPLGASSSGWAWTLDFERWAKCSTTVLLLLLVKCQLNFLAISPLWCKQQWQYSNPWLWKMRQVFYHCAALTGQVSTTFYQHFLPPSASSRGWAWTLDFERWCEWSTTLLLPTCLEHFLPTEAELKVLTKLSLHTHLHPCMTERIMSIYNDIIFSYVWVGQNCEFVKHIGSYVQIILSSGFAGQGSH